MIPSLSDLVKMWLNENFPKQGWDIGPTGLVYNQFGWLIGAVFEKECTLRYVNQDDPSKVEILHAADPEFFEKLRVGVQSVFEAKLALHLITNIAVEAPRFTLAS